MQSEASSLPAAPPVAIVTSTVGLERSSGSSETVSEASGGVNTFIATSSQYVKLRNISIPPSNPPSSQPNVSSSPIPMQSHLVPNESQSSSSHTHDHSTQSNSVTASNQSRSSSRDSDQERTEEDHPRSSATRAIVSILRIQAYRLRIAKLRTKFEVALLTLLLTNVVYTYYIDHKLAILFLRVVQLFRIDDVFGQYLGRLTFHFYNWRKLLHLPYTNPSFQHFHAVLLLLSNIPLLIFHIYLFSSLNRDEDVGDMLFINFIGPEPKSLINVIIVDFIIIILETTVLQCRWDSSSIRIVTALPVPISDPLIPVDDDPIVFLNRLNERSDDNNENDLDSVES